MQQDATSMVHVDTYPHVQMSIGRTPNMCTTHPSNVTQFQNPGVIPRPVSKTPNCWSDIQSPAAQATIPNSNVQELYPSPHKRIQTPNIRSNIQISTALMPQPERLYQPPAAQSLGPPPNSPRRYSISISCSLLFACLVKYAS